jgi:hypothetical protein
MALPRRHFLLAASGPLQRRRDGVLDRLAVLYLSVQIDLIFHLYLVCPQTWKP